MCDKSKLFGNPKTAEDRTWRRFVFDLEIWEKRPTNRLFFLFYMNQLVILSPSIFLVWLICFRCERPRSGHRPRTRARDGRTMDAKLMRWQQIIMTFGARVQIMSTSGSAREMDQESRKYRGACPRRCPPRRATHIVSHARFRRIQFENSSR